MTDPRDLIQRLADELEGEIEHKVGWGEPDYADELINEARAYLAQPEPEPTFTPEEVKMIAAPWSYLQSQQELEGGQ